MHSLPAPAAPPLELNWPQFVKKQVEACTATHKEQGLSHELASQIDDYLHRNIYLLEKTESHVLIGSDYHDANILVERVQCKWRVSGFIDFGDAMIGSPVYDFVAPCLWIGRGHQNLISSFFQGYGIPYTSELKEICFLYTLLHRFANLEYALQHFISKHPKIERIEEIRDRLWPH